jgi:long-chain acyl-CoA synthetase
MLQDRPWLAEYPAGVGADPPPSPGTALELWSDAAAIAPSQPCIHYRDATLSYQEVDEASEHFAGALAKSGLEPGDRVGIYLQNLPEWPISLLATWKAGGIAVALNPMFKARELQHHLNDSSARAIVCSQDLYLTVVREVVSDTNVEMIIVAPTNSIWGGDATSVNAGVFSMIDMIGHREPRPEIGQLPAPDIAVLTYTSGTTGPPKGAMNTHRNIVLNAANAAQWLGLDRGDPILGIAPLFHITGLVLHMAISWRLAAPLIIFGRFDPGEALRCLDRYRAAFTVGSITAFIAMLDHPNLADTDFSSLRKVASGGAPISPAVLERFEQLTGLYIHNVYGLTETTSPTHIVPTGRRAPVDPESGALSVGVPIPGVEVRVVGLDSGRDLPPGSAGELWIRGPMVVPGYWEKPDETAKAITDGWLHTGDVGVMNSDGWFFIVDRAKDQINASGYKVWPREVEDVLYQHPAVREAAVVGVPDDYRGETVKAFVSTFPDQTVNPDELIDFCRQRMAAYKYPRLVEILEELPKTPTGKFLRRELRKRT